MKQVGIFKIASKGTRRHCPRGFRSIPVGGGQTRYYVRMVGRLYREVFPQG